MVTGKCLVLKRRFISCLVKFIKNPGKKKKQKVSMSIKIWERPATFCL